MIVTRNYGTVPYLQLFIEVCSREIIDKLYQYLENNLYSFSISINKKYQCLVIGKNGSLVDLYANTLTKEVCIEIPYNDSVSLDDILKMGIELTIL